MRLQVQNAMTERAAGPVANAPGPPRSLTTIAIEAQALFEIVMGLCGAFLICHRIDPLVTQELAILFKQNCPQGLIVFIIDRTPRRAPRGAVYIIAEATGPETLGRLLQSRYYFLWHAMRRES
jgi:hypothetical protein